MEGEEEGVFSEREVVGCFFDVVVAMGPEGAVACFFFAGGEEEVGWEFAGDHDACGCGVEPAFASILLYHSINWNYMPLATTKLQLLIGFGFRLFFFGEGAPPEPSLWGAGLVGICGGLGLGRGGGKWKKF